MTPDHFHGDVGAHGMAHDYDAGPPNGTRWLCSSSGLHEGVELVLDELDLVFHIVVMGGKGRLRLDFEACEAVAVDVELMVVFLLFAAAAAAAAAEGLEFVG